MVVDRLAILSWQMGGNRKVPFPKPLARPGVDDGSTRHGGTDRPAAQVVSYLRRFAPKREEVTDG